MIYSASSPSLGYMGHTVDSQEFFIHTVLIPLLSVAVVDRDATILAEMVSVWSLPSMSTWKEIVLQISKNTYMYKEVPVAKWLWVGWKPAGHLGDCLWSLSREGQRLSLLHFSLLFIDTPPDHPVFFSFEVRSIALQACLWFSAVDNPVLVLCCVRFYWK